MGITYIEGQVQGPTGKKADVTFLVDSGTTYSLIPKETWEAVQLKEKRKMTFILADGTSVERGISEAYLILNEGEGHSPVILGEKEDEALLGVVTLEIMGLVLNPFNRSLHPMRMLM